MTDANLFRSILAMDSYNRGDGQGTPNGLDLSTAALGSATFLGLSENSVTGFFATSYSLNGKTVISFRGTDFDGLPDLKDAAFGWVVGAGRYDGQFADVAAYYDQVTGHDLFDGPATDVEGFSRL